MRSREVHDPFADASTTPFWDLALVLWSLPTLLGGGTAAMFAVGYFLNGRPSEAWPFVGTLTVLLVVEAALLVGRVLARRG